MFMFIDIHQLLRLNISVLSNQPGGEIWKGLRTSAFTIVRPLVGNTGINAAATRAHLSVFPSCSSTLCD